ncbi:hypothetical protein HNR44_003363 [Geomicrobium halophilum]|uniref:YolD-like protein n=1 Tax=Geomicrobium halophilum TaxID=549000 RepID=A0A841PVU8_9BACL|nr:YolD-like family protein [Geomicrobium halophilum]MBB6451356.1 hypothetical protein [Geomicrobium halophilum]
MNKLTPGSNMRWESSRMILPEHREQWLCYREQQQKVARPLLDEQRWSEIEWVLREGMNENASLVFTYWENGAVYKVVGTCQFIDHTFKQFRVHAEDGEAYYLDFSAIVNVE